MQIIYVSMHTFDNDDNRQLTDVISLPMCK